MKTSKVVYVAMSGGVDSSVAAALLKKQGFQVVGVFMKPWSPQSDYRLSTIANCHFCPWQKDREDAMRVAALLDIPLKTWDFSREYGKRVTRYMIDGYREGITPNPDVMCNKEIKFGLFFKKAMREGADYIATGHYARIKKSQRPKAKGQRILKAKDRNKDQTYFLWTLNQKVLARTLFPVGAYTKPEVRALARKFWLPTHDKKDSQGICFVGPLDVKEFLTRHIKRRAGIVKHVDGRVLGEHDGAYYYTIGQRHGLDIKDGGGPYFVIKKDVRENIIYVGRKQDLMTRRARLSGIRWINNCARPPFKLEVKIRYRTSSAKAVLKRNGIIEFFAAQRAVTPGQSAVFYRGMELLGGGIIRSAS